VDLVKEDKRDAVMRTGTVKLVLGVLIVTVFVSFESFAARVQWSTEEGGNGHWYEAVLVGSTGITWAEAKTAAEAAGGHLVTIHSAAENAFVHGLVADNAFWFFNGQQNGGGPWLGGFQPVGSSEPGGGWRWLTTEQWDYTNWEAREPNNHSGPEDFLAFWVASGVRKSTWNDVPVVLGPSYIVEWEEELAGSGVTLIAHRWNSEAHTWVAQMRDAIASRINGTADDVSYADITVTREDLNPLTPLTVIFDRTIPSATDLSLTLVTLDWSDIDGGIDDFFEVAPVTNIAHLVTDKLIENGLVELPIHLVAHSRGCSLVTEIARLLGQKGIWVHQVTAFDPNVAADLLLPDPNPQIYENVLFADNYYQKLSLPFGIPLKGAYNRNLTLVLTGGYTHSHSDTHLWYHGTIDLQTPTSDGAADITEPERVNWWFESETRGSKAGFHYSMLGGGDRLSSEMPAGFKTDQIVDGYHKKLGGQGSRQKLNWKNAQWPNIITLEPLVSGSVTVTAGSSLQVNYTYQDFDGPTEQVTIYLDVDQNPYNGNDAAQFMQITHSKTGKKIKGASVILDTSGASLSAGAYYLYAKITDGTHTRYLYAPKTITFVDP
jgi:hypothetical protein